jgi:H-NS histone family protein
MLQISTFTEATLATLTPRSEIHGDDHKPAVSLGLELTVANDLLDVIDPTLRTTLYKAPDTKSLPGVADVLNVLRCQSIDRVLLPNKHEGWSLEVEDGIDDEAPPLTFGSCKVDKMSVEPKQGGSVVLRMRVGTSDLDAERSGMLGMHVGQSIRVKLTAPKPGAAESDGKPKGKQPDATDLFVAGAKQGDGGVAWPFPGAAAGSMEPPPQRVTTEVVKEKKAGRAQSSKAKPAKPAFKYRNAATGETWSGRGLMPKWLKVAIGRGQKVSDFELGGAA